MEKILGLIVGIMLSLCVMADEWYDETTGFTWYYTISGDGAKLTGCSPKEGQIPPLPSILGGKPVTHIGGGSWDGSAFKGLKGSLIIPDSVRIIDNYAFRFCSGFTGSLTIPNSVTTIGFRAFDCCSGFTGTLTISDGVTIIESSAFYECSGFTGSLTIPDSVTSIEGSAFYGCTGFNGLLTIGGSVTSIGSHAFTNCSGIKLLFMKGIPPTGFISSQLGMKKISYSFEYGAEWQKFLKDNGGLIYDAGYIQSNAQTVSIVSSKIRETDPTVMDVVYKVTSSQPTVKVRALAFKDGVRSFANVVRPETFIEGTDANIGDGIVPNVEHKLSWKVSADWQETLAKVKFEVLAIEDGLLPLELTTLPKTDSQPKMEVSWNVMFDDWVFDALMWLYADKDLGLTLANGVLKNGNVRLADGASVSKTMYDATVYVYGKMGYELLQGDRLEYARQMLRRNLPGVSQAQYAVKVIEE